MKNTLKNKIKKIKLLVLDVDGVLTNGDIVLNHKGKEIKIFNVQDGFGIVLFKNAGYKTAIITARTTEAVRIRAKDLKIDRIYQNAYPKMNAYKRLLRDLKVKDHEVCFMGDDLPDIGILKKVGFAVSVPNAVDDVKKTSEYVTKHEGGAGAVREVIELILKTQGRWKEILKLFS